MDVEIVTIGDELLLGDTIDTNAAWIARELAQLGVSVVRRTTVGDETRSIADAVRGALARGHGVVTTGGLGPTADDRTKPAIAELFGQPLVFDAAQWERLRRFWRDRGRSGEPPDANRQQVMIPAGATVLPNSLGTAPGVLLEDERGGWVAVLPGVPREMRAMIRESLLPWLWARLPVERQVVRSLLVRCTGIAESQLPAVLGDLAEGVDGASLAYLPGQDGIDLRLTLRGVAAAEADRRLAAASRLVRERVGKYVYAEGPLDLAEVVLAMCRDRSLRLAVAESCTGGLLGARLTSISGASDVFMGGVIAYDDAVKTALLGVAEETLLRHGAVSEEVAREMAGGVRDRLGVDVGVAITGVAGPTGGTPEKPVGLVWVAVDFGWRQRVHGGRFHGDRAEIRHRASQAALDMIRRELADRG
jgi:nicotinamide-nucleotide amidase